jgi:hypothetical protein
MISGIKKIFLNSPDSKGVGRDVILTGIPRSGTTLSCKILLSVENQIALNEPIAGELFRKGKPPLKVIQQCFSQYRKSLLKKGTAPARTKQGQITDNAYSKGQKKRERVLERTVVDFKKPLSADFTLILKHCAEFTLILEELQDNYECFAMVRNPLAVLASWNSVNVPVSRGKVAKSQIFKPQFHRQIEQIGPLFEKQLFILNWYFRQYEILAPENVIKYERVISSQGEALNTISGKETHSPDTLYDQNQNSIYDRTVLYKYLDLLRNSEREFSPYYSIEEIEELAQKMGV